VSWFRVDDKAAFHAKVLKAGNEAFGALVRMGCWASDHLTDGHIPAETASLIAPGEWTISRLLLVGFLEKHGDDYVIHDFLDYNPTAEEVNAKRDAEKAKKARWRDAKATKSTGVSTVDKINVPASSTSSRSRPDPNPVLQNPPPARTRVIGPEQLWINATGLQPGPAVLDAWLLAKNAAPAKGKAPEEYFSEALGAFVAWVDGVRADRRPQKSPRKFVEHFARVQEILEGKRPAVPDESPLPRNAPLPPCPADLESKTEPLP
jgi:hypothetical protein